jgi:predicted metal-dependent phosphoesterase TrpH
MDYIDLHIHTNFSDGSLTPEEVVDISIKRGLKVISITDHDNIEGVNSIISKIHQYDNIKIIPGVEISAEYEKAIEGEIHILGYFINLKSKSLSEKLNYYRQERKKRALQIIEKFNRIGINIDTSMLDSNNSIGRLHIAKYLVKNGFTKNIKEAFRKYLGYNCPCYVKKNMFTVEEAIRTIVEANGLPVLAHPMISFSNIELIENVLKKGMVGIEVWHTKHTSSDINMLYSYAKERKLIITGGSDCHGYVNGNPPLIGALKIPYEVYTELQLYQKPDV